MTSIGLLLLRGPRKQTRRRRSVVPEKTVHRRQGRTRPTSLRSRKRCPCATRSGWNSFAWKCSPASTMCRPRLWRRLLSTRIRKISAGAACLLLHGRGKCLDTGDAGLGPQEQQPRSIAPRILTRGPRGNLSRGSSRKKLERLCPKQKNRCVCSADSRAPANACVQCVRPPYECVNMMR